MRYSAIAIAAALGLALTTYAQPPGGGFGGFGRGGAGGSVVNFISLSKQLQDELKIEKEQLDKLTAALTKAREETRDDQAKAFNRETPQEERAELSKKIREITTKAAHSALKPEQIKRLNQIENQRAGLEMYGKEDVQKSLNLTDAQKEKIDAIREEVRKDIRELQSANPNRGFGRPDEQSTRKRRALEKEATENILAVLEDNQKSQIKNLTGEPFELNMQGLTFGGGAGGFGGGAGGFNLANMMNPVQILPFQRDQIKMTDEQKKQVDDLVKETEEKLNKILSEEQQKQLKELKERGFQFPGGRPGGGRPGGPGGR